MADNNRLTLDNPVLFSLSETHEPLAIVYDGAKFYPPDYCPFGGFTHEKDILKASSAYAQLCDHFFIVGEKPVLPHFLKIEKELICLQMIIPRKIALTVSPEIIPLEMKHRDDLYQLVNAVQPGYFKSKTFFLGDYFGIFKDGKLIAVAGERMKMNRHTEVSAIVTHPDYTGKGYGGQLTSHVVNKIFSENKFPFLHVLETNHHAIALYKRLGFKIRRKISFWSIGR